MIGESLSSVGCLWGMIFITAHFVGNSYLQRMKIMYKTFVFKQSVLNIFYLTRPYWGISRKVDDITVYLGRVGVMYFWSQNG